MKEVLQFAALFLAVVNGLAVLRMHFRDRPRLLVRSVHPDVYQWWFRLPDGQRDKIITRRWGFIAYISFANSGLRKTTVDSWRLVVRRTNWTKVELKPINLPNPSLDKGSWQKSFPVLGQKTIDYDGSTTVDSGVSISGMVYYIYECHGHEAWNPRVTNGVITGSFVSTDVFGSKVKCKINFREKTLARIKELVPNIEDVYS